MEVKDREGSDENMKVTVQMLKSRTGQFDLESILFLKLRNIGITNLGCIGDCVNVERLDLSGNDISNLAPLTSLKVLIVLNLSANRISNLDPLCSCENLQNLNLSGNLISSVDSLRSLSELKNLEVIRLKDTVCNFSNPVCMNTAYHSAMLEIFPKIKSLDGERLSGRGSDLYQLCKKMEDSLKEMLFLPLESQELSTGLWIQDRDTTTTTNHHLIACPSFIRHISRVLQNILH
ncbi:leucine-rich repeat-containing protein 61 isoform X3 [Chiloscyllium plagiosum]|uniref:leucine-rich repeat-containing protein 61 isoform X3 n=1 Tax=Chiloscyllium plagiosum TaxID=36176 RepID=UPI001CB833DE|nr:leucine-rich repeat-containing protein 61 isoform X3 [Chiloscyllium plagiosum]